jgi:hypothetical protein
MGYAVCNKEFPNADVSPYLCLENIDPKWLKAIGYEGPALEVQKVREEKDTPALERKGEDASVGGQPLLAAVEWKNVLIHLLSLILAYPSYTDKQELVR